MVDDLDAADSVGGRLVFRFIGSMFAVIALGLGAAGANSLIDGGPIGVQLSSAIVIALGLVVGRLAVWCFGSDRRLSVTDPT